MKPYSEDLRSKIVQALHRGMNKCEAARTFSVSLSSVKRYANMDAKDGESLAPIKPPGKTLKLDQTAMRLLEADLDERPTATLSQRREYLRVISGVQVSISTISRMINERIEWSRKKGAGAPASETSGSEPPGG